MNCGVCSEPLVETSEDIVILNGSCRHKHHVRCYTETYIMNPDNACKSCSQKMDPSLWDNPLDLKPIEEVIPTPSLLSPFRAIASFVSDKLDNSIDSTLRSVLKQNLPVATLQRKGCTPDALLKEMDTRLFSFLVNETNYTTKHLKSMGFNWEHYLLAGFTSLHVAKARERFQEGLFTDIIVTLSNFSELCSGDVSVMLSLKLSAKEWKLLCPVNLPPVGALYRLGMRTQELIEMDFSLQDWQEIMGLDKLVMQQLYKFRIEEYLQFIKYDQPSAEEFAHRFKFNPFKTAFGIQHGRNPFIPNR